MGLRYIFLVCQFKILLLMGFIFFCSTVLLALFVQAESYDQHSVVRVFVKDEGFYSPFYILSSL